MGNDELEMLKAWLCQREVRVSSYRPEKSINHPVLRETRVVHSIIEAIKTGDLNAIELGCELVIETRKLPFGKILKSNVLSALKQQVQYINADYRQQLSQTLVEIMSWQYPPRELRELCKLVQRFESKYSDCVLENAICISDEAERWLGFLSGEK